MVPLPLPLPLSVAVRQQRRAADGRGPPGSGTSCTADQRRQRHTPRMLYSAESVLFEGVAHCFALELCSSVRVFNNTSLRISLQCTFDNAILDTFTFFNLYNSKANVQNSSVRSLEGPSVFMVGGGCPEKTEVVAKVTKFLFSLEVYMICVAIITSYNIIGKQ